MDVHLSRPGTTPMSIKTNLFSSAALVAWLFQTVRHFHTGNDPDKVARALQCLDNTFQFAKVGCGVMGARPSFHVAGIEFKVAEQIPMD